MGILIFKDVEELDFVGPFEVFGAANRIQPNTLETFTLAEDTRPVRAVHGLRVIPDYDLENSPNPNVLLIPGGRGTRRQVKEPRTIGYIQKAAKSCELVASVCTGALILATAGLLDGKRATTHWAAIDELRQFKKVSVDHQRYIHDGKIMTSAGISAGIDMALHILELFYGSKLSEEVAHRMEYRVNNAS